MRVCGLFRVIVVGNGGDLVFGVGCVCFLRRVWEVRGVSWVGLVRSRMRLVTYVSSSPVIMYLRSRVLLGMCEWGESPLVYGGKVDEEHVHAASPSTRLLGSILDMSDWCYLVEEWGCYF